MFIFANIRDFGKLFTVNHKHVCVCVNKSTCCRSCFRCRERKQNWLGPHAHRVTFCCVYL